jgi:3-oxoacyl-[acyl-carrier protein] reductase
MQIDLEGRVAIVTGAGRGIGRVIATTLAREGVTTVATDIDLETLGTLAREFAENEWRGEVWRCDVRFAEPIDSLIRRVLEAYGRIDILVNNAGVAPGGPVESLSEATWDANHETNLKGTFLMCRSVIPQMKRQHSGRIINASSFAAIVPSLNNAAYSASKAGVIALTRTLAGELGPWNITVNCYAPGMIPTQMNHFAELPQDRQERLLDTLSLRRWGEAKDIAQLICFLSSDLAGYITGSLIDISGGKLATQIPRMAYEIAAQQHEYEF